MSAFLLRVAWRQSLLRLLAIFVLGGLLGAVFGQTWAALALTGLVLLAWHYWRLHLLVRRLDRRLPLAAPSHNQGLLDGLETILHARQSEKRTRTRRLLSLLRGYRKAAAALPDGALILDRNEGRILWFNKAARKRLGLRYKQSIGHEFTRYLDEPRVRDWLAAGDSDEPLLGVTSPADAHAQLSLRLLPYASGQWLLLVGDVTQLTRLEQMRRDFVANVSHELRTPLTVIHGYLDMMEPEDNPEWAPMVEEMRKQSQRMTQLVEDLLTLSRLEAQDRLPEDIVPMAPLLITLRREAEALSQGRQTVVVEDSAQCDLFGSAKELHSAFSNLVSNAVRYTSIDGQVTIRFFRTADGGASLAVQDTGYGIPAQHLPRITERFYRVSTSRARETGGTGLGLSIVKHVLSLHQGHLEVESEVGRGSTFSCVFDAQRVRSRQGDGYLQ